MIEVKKQCVNCKGKRYKKNINPATGQTACFLCFGRGYFVEMVDDDVAARIELMQMPKERLALVDCDRYRWQCYVEGCTKHTVIRDYGIAPMYHTRWGWLNLQERVMLCYKHGQAEEKRGELLPHKPGYGENHLVALNDGSGK